FRLTLNSQEFWVPSLLISCFQSPAPMGFPLPLDLDQRAHRPYPHTNQFHPMDLDNQVDPPDSYYKRILPPDLLQHDLFYLLPMNPNQQLKHFHYDQLLSWQYLQMYNFLQT